MNFIYHGVPAGFEGSELRKNLPYKRIPKLICL